MSALALCLCDIERRLFGGLNEKDPFLQKASFIARLGSGSACRSVYPGVVIWGKTKAFENASDLYAVDLNQLAHPIFSTFKDDILIIRKEKGGQKAYKFNYTAVAKGNDLDQNRLLQPGDTVVVP